LVVANTVPAGVSVFLNTGCGPVGVAQNPPRLPARFDVMPAQPNPTRSSVTIRFALPEARRVDAEVLDVTGRRVRTLVRAREYAAGEHTEQWDRRSDVGAALPDGLYFVRVRAGRETGVARVVLMR